MPIFKIQIVENISVIGWEQKQLAMDD